jgi:hypothetical protein
MLPIEITLTYRDREGATGSMVLSPKIYFDLDAEDERAGTIFDLVWSRPHACDYLEIPLEKLGTTSIDIHCATTKERIRVFERFWANGRCRTIFRQDLIDEREASWLRIVEIGTNDGIHFLRFGSESKEESGLLEHHLVLKNDEVHFLFPEEQ